MALRAEANPKRETLPAITHYPQQHFSHEDVAKVIEQVASKGNKYAQMRKALTSQQASALIAKLQESCFVKVAVRKVLIKMGEERRLGAGLRGFSRLLLEEIENECWPLVLIERSLLQLQQREKGQLQVLKQLLGD